MAVLDPHRTLGVRPGASIDEVKSAYRRLAKRYHPDSTGAATSQRFIDVQRAYEMLTASVVRSGRPKARPAARPAARPPERATGHGGSTPGSTPGSSSGDRPSSSGPRRASDRSGDSRTGRPRGGRRKATLGSTSYDEAIATPFEPGWQGASWYGPASGTYWTINPREYADPRKHGPEYQQRARRVATAARESTDLDGPVVERDAASPMDPGPSAERAEPVEAAPQSGGGGPGAAGMARPPSEALGGLGGLVGLLIAAGGVLVAVMAVLLIAGQP